MADLNWNLAQVPNLFGSAISAQRAGRQDRDEQAAREALSLYNTDPQAGIAALRPLDPEGAMRLDQDQETRRVRALTERQDRDRRAALSTAVEGDISGAQRMAGGDGDTLAAISKLSEEKRADSKMRADILAGIFTKAEGMSLEQAEAFKRQVAPSLVASGMFTQEQIDGFAMTPENIAAQKAQALGIKGLLEQANKDREFASRDADRRADNDRDRAKLGIAQQNANTATFRAHKPPAPRGRVLGATLDPNDGW